MSQCVYRIQPAFSRYSASVTVGSPTTRIAPRAGKSRMAATVLHLIYFSLAVAILVPTACSQTTAVQQLRSAFSSSQVTRVTLSGDANWYAGSLKDSGTVTLTAASDGSSQMQLTLDQTGERTESQLAIGPAMKCQWSGTDAKAHQSDYFNCLKPTIWFLPSLNIQAATMPASTNLADLGVESTPTGGLRHLRAQFAPALFEGDASALAQLPECAVDIDLDPTTSLPVTLRFGVRPDNGADVKIPIVVKFSDYRNVNGVQIPYRIERYVNGTLQLQITLQSAQI